MGITMDTGKMVGLGGLEPPASPLSGVRSNQLSYRPFLRRYFALLVVAPTLSLGYVPGVRALIRSRLRLD